MVRRSTGSPKRPGQGRWHSSGTPQAARLRVIAGSSSCRDRHTGGLGTRFRVGSRDPPRPPAGPGGRADLPDSGTQYATVGKTAVTRYTRWLQPAQRKAGQRADRPRRRPTTSVSCATAVRSAPSASRSTPPPAIATNTLRPSPGSRWQPPEEPSAPGARFTSQASITGSHRAAQFTDHSTMNWRRRQIRLSEIGCIPVSGEISEVASSPGIAGREGVLECSATTPPTWFCSLPTSGRPGSFYADRLGLEIDREAAGAVWFNCGGGSRISLSASTTGTADMQTQASWRVGDLGAELAQLRSRGWRSWSTTPQA